MLRSNDDGRDSKWMRKFVGPFLLSAVRLRARQTRLFNGIHEKKRVFENIHGKRWAETILKIEAKPSCAGHGHKSFWERGHLFVFSTTHSAGVSCFGPFFILLAFFLSSSWSPTREFAFYCFLVCVVIDRSKIMYGLTVRSRLLNIDLGTQKQIESLLYAL